MSHKTLTKIALVMIVVFFVTVVVYPLLFNSQKTIVEPVVAPAQPISVGK